MTVLGGVEMRGCRREMVVMRTRESPIFESAYFLLRRKREISPSCDMLAEANRLLAFGGGMTQKERKRCRFLPFFIGFLLGALLAGVTLFFLFPRP